MEPVDVEARKKMGRFYSIHEVNKQYAVDFRFAFRRCLFGRNGFHDWRAWMKEKIVRKGKGEEE